MGRGISAESRRLIDTACTVLEAIRPASVRAVCYKLFVLGLIPDMGKNSTSKVSRLLVRAREDGFVPWEWIVDGGRVVRRVSTWSAPREIMKDALRGYRFDYWQQQPNRAHLVVEKETVASTLRPVLDEFAVPVSFMKGFASATAVNGLAEIIGESDKPMHLLYCGDHDPSGRYMSDVDLPERIQRYGTGGQYLLRRIAVTRSQAESLDLPSFPVTDKSTDARYDWFLRRHGYRCWELDALDPNTLRALVREQVVALIDADAWEHATLIEAAQRESLDSFVSRLPGG